jgi:mannose-6-phosphate isomerase-like protein (cupin superfamily)
MNKQFIPLDYANALEEYWSPRVISSVDDYHIKVARLKGSISWHKHDNEDELFLILKGELKIEFETSSVNLHEGEVYIIPKGVLHNPVAENECLVMLFEKNTTLHTGTKETQKSRSIQEQLRPLNLC